MNRQEKKKFVNTFMRNMKTEILNNIQKMPENWNGIEMRYYIAEKFQGQVEISTARKKEANNTIIVDNL